MARKTEGDMRDGYSQGVQDRRTFLPGYEREPEQKRLFAKAHNFPGSYLGGYNRGWAEAGTSVRSKPRKAKKATHATQAA